MTLLQRSYYMLLRAPARLRLTIAVRQPFVHVVCWEELGCRGPRRRVDKWAGVSHQSQQRGMLGIWPRAMLKRSQAGTDRCVCHKTAAFQPIPPCVC